MLMKQHALITILTSADLTRAQEGLLCCYVGTARPSTCLSQACKQAYSDPLNTELTVQDWRPQCQVLLRSG